MMGWVRDWLKTPAQREQEAREEKERLEKERRRQEQQEAERRAKKRQKQKERRQRKQVEEAPKRARNQFKNQLQHRLKHWRSEATLTFSISERNLPWWSNNMPMRWRVGINSLNWSEKTIKKSRKRIDKRLSGRIAHRGIKKKEKEANASFFNVGK